MDNSPEKRCCAACGHKGSDADASATESWCAGCMETVEYPVEDVCPECGATNCMMLACPECGGEYSLDEGDGIETPNVELTGAAPGLLAQRPATEGSEVERLVGGCGMKRRSGLHFLGNSERLDEEFMSMALGLGLGSRTSALPHPTQEANGGTLDQGRPNDMDFPNRQADSPIQRQRVGRQK